MSTVRASNAVLAVNVFCGDAKTLLAFDLTADSARAGLAGFTVEVHPPGVPPYYVDNNLRLAASTDHAQVAGQSAYSSVNAPIHKFRWVHVPGLVHQGGSPTFGTYSYVVTPRYFSAAGALQPLDPSLGVTIDVEVGPFVKGSLTASFTRGYVQSQAFVRHFGPTTHLRPADDSLTFDTAAAAATGPDGQTYSYAQEYEWLGFTARQRIFDLLTEVQTDPTLTVDVFAYDLNEPDVCALLLKLAASDQVRIILDDCPEHHSTTKTLPEDQFYDQFTAQSGSTSILRGHFNRYAHDKVLVLSDKDGPRTVLTGSTNFSINGLYVNANHVLVFEDRDVAGTYAAVFNEAWQDGIKAKPFAASPWATQPYVFGGGTSATPSTSITFSPHTADIASQILGALVDRVKAESSVTPPPFGSVFFAVMDLGGTSANPVYEALNEIHSDTAVFSMGISDSPKGISLYVRGQKAGLLVSGKPGHVVLPPPFDQVPQVVGHEVHHKFVVCGFRGADPVVYCGSSNLALGGEQANGDNLLAIRDADVATAFVIEAVELVDHYQFLDTLSTKSATSVSAAGATADRRSAAAAAGWFLGTTDAWAQKFFDPDDLHCADREFFGS
ncbi:phospholipase D-like domain-containing protein [Mycobacterium sp. DL99]|uniref:phospholipase D-like domain-containing protein n=1 Tax=Mycobacterium sp. DL99 TaxID=2528957 RepID=UPI001081681A|nr:phospholipase D-like domain-containing protein [Mycobacterium sp. DL99]